MPEQHRDTAPEPAIASAGNLSEQVQEDGFENPDAATDSEPVFVNISGYRFIELENPEALKQALQNDLKSLAVKGTVLLAHEGINVTLAGTAESIRLVIELFKQYPPLRKIQFKHSESNYIPHKRLRVRVRSGIISFDDRIEDDVRTADSAHTPVAPTLSPRLLNQWLDEGRELTLLDTRNDYEVESGSFDQAIQLNIKHFRHFTKKALAALDEGTLDADRPIVTFCTGGIRCEKAAPWLLANGCREVYQVDGGIISYLTQTDGRHWRGDCFVFDDRVELDKSLRPTGAGLCDHCQLAVPAGESCDCRLGPHYHSSLPDKVPD